MGAASSIDEFDDDLRQKGVEALLDRLEKVSISPRPAAPQANSSYLTHLIVKSERYGAASVKYSNYFISWRKLLFVGSAIPMSYASSTLTAMTILGVLVRGAVHRFDEIDAKILAIIHKNSNILPISTHEFYARISDQFPAEINEALYMKRIVDLSGFGAISIDEDSISIVEYMYSFGD